MTVETSYTEARRNLAAVLDRAVDDREPVVIIRRGKPSAVVIAADELASLVETAYLFRVPANADRLTAALDQLDRSEGRVMTVEALRRKFGLDA